MSESTISQKVWNIAGILNDAGVSNQDYLEQITFLLFMKMVDENSKVPEYVRWQNTNALQFPDTCQWDTLKSLSGDELRAYYENMLSILSKQHGMIGEI